MLDWELAQAGYKCDDKDIDEGVVTELDLWYSNTFMLYRTFYSWIKNYARKMKRGVYTKKLAIQGIANNYVPQIMRDYKQANGLSAVNKCTKLATAIGIVNEIEENIKDQSIEYWIKFEIPRGY